MRVRSFQRNNDLGLKQVFLELSKKLGSPEEEILYFTVAEIPQMLISEYRNVSNRQLFYYLLSTCI